MEIKIFGTRFCFIKYFIHSLYKGLNYKPLLNCSTNLNQMKIKHFYNPEINNPGDFDWEKSKVTYKIKQFKSMESVVLVKIEKELFHELGQIIVNGSNRPYVYDEVVQDNVQQLIDLLCSVRDFIEYKTILI